MQDSGYFRAKTKQEEYIKSGSVPYTIVQAMQFFEFIGGIADSSVRDGAVHLSTGQMQPIAADDVAEIVAEVALSKPLNGTMEIVGDERASLSDIVSNYMNASYFGVRLQERSLVPAAQRKPAMMRQRFPLCMTTRCPTFPARA